MKRIVYIITTCCLLLLCSKAYSQEWISIDGTPKGEAVTIKTLKSDYKSHQVRFSIHGLYDQVSARRGEAFHQLSIGKQGCLSEIGCPSLPILTQLIAVPEGASISVSVKEEKWTDVGVGRIYPFQKPQLEDETAKEFSIDKTAYKQAFVPQLVQISNEMEWRGVRNVRLAICPFKYYPTQNQLSVLSEFVLEVTFLQGKVPVVEKQVYETNDIFHLFDNDIFTNNPQISKIQAQQNNVTTSLPSGKMLIIVGSDLSQIMDSDKMKEFRKWKAFKGYYTTVVSTSTTGTTEEAIKNYIQGQYNNGVRYVLFVGDHTHIPMKDVSSPYYDEDDPYRSVYSDYWYGCMGGSNDYEADIAVGRFSIANAQQFENMVDKTIKYEKSYISSNKVLLVSHLENAEEPTYQYSYQNCSNLIKNGNYDETMTFVTAYGAYNGYGGNEATNADVVSQINQGAHIVNYRGHAGVDFWGNKQEYGDTIWNYPREVFWSSEISNMNSQTCAVFFCIACHTGNVTESDCMLETFTRATNGAVAFIGATRNSYRVPNHTYNQYLFDQLLNEGIYHIGNINVAAHIKNITTMNDPTLAQDNALCYLLGGDPTLELWTAVPQRINDVSIQMGTSQVNFTTSINNSFYGSVVHEDGTNLQNTAYMGYGTFLKPYFNFYFTVNCHNWYPHITYVNLTSEEIEATVFDYDGYSYVTPLAIRGGYAANDDDSVVRVKSGNKLIIQNGSGGVIIEDSFECEEGAVFEIK